MIQTAKIIVELMANFGCFLSNVQKRFFYFFHVFTFLRFFNFYPNVYYIYLTRSSQSLPTPGVNH